MSPLTISPVSLRDRTVRIGALAAAALLLAGLGAVRVARRDAARWQLEVTPHSSAVSEVQAKRMRLLGVRTWSYEAAADKATLMAFHRRQLTAAGWRPVAEQAFERDGLRVELALRDADGRRRVTLVMSEARGATLGQ